jgi:uncharacterized protein YciI
MMHFLLIYQLTDDYLMRRGDYREEHLRLAWAEVEKGMLMLGGALETPTDQAMLLFHDENAARRFAEADPYVKNGLVKSWAVRRWTTVVGTLASSPVRPED